MDQAEQLRNVIKQKSQEVPPHTARVVTITSGKGGVGKSNIAVNMAVELRKMGNRVIIFDADFGLANVEVMFGAVPQYNLSDLIYRGKSIREIITTGFFVGRFGASFPSPAARFCSFSAKISTFFCCFQNVFNFPASNFLLAAGIFRFFQQFSVCFQVFHFIPIYNKENFHYEHHYRYRPRLLRSLIQQMVRARR